MTAPDPEIVDGKRSSRALIGALVFVAFAWRCIGYFDAWPNPDEGAYYAIALRESWAALFAEIRHHTHPPGIYLLHRALAQLSDEIAFLRLPSLIGGALAVLGVYRITAAAWTPRAGLIAAALLAFAPGPVVMSQVLRPYGLHLALIAFAAAAALDFARGASKARAVQAIALAAAALCLHYSTLLLLPGLAGLLLHGALRHVERRRALALAAVGVAVWATIVGALYALHIGPQLAGSDQQLAAQRGWLAPFFPDSAAELWSAWVGVQRGLFGPRADALGFGLLVFGLVQLTRRPAWPLLGLVVTTFACASAAALLAQYPLGASRHSLYLAILVVPVAAIGIDRVLAARPATRAAAALIAVAALGAPDLARRAIGAEVPEPTPLGERLPRTGSMRSALTPLDEAARTGGLVVMDRQTYRMLSPYFRAAGIPLEHGTGRAGVLTHFAWGRARVAVSQAWMLRTGPRNLTHASHVFGFLHRSSPLPEIAEQRSGWLVLGGWRRDHAFGETQIELLPGATMAQRSAPQSAQEEPVPLGVAKLDWVAYTNALRLPAAREREASETRPSRPR